MLPNLAIIYRKNGLSGLLIWLNVLKRNLLVNLTIKFINFIFPFSEILQTTLKYDANIPKFGFSKSSRQFINDLNIRLTSDSNVPHEGACLIFGNHPTGLDPYIISACLKRDDIYVVADIYQKSKGQNIGEHIIPIIYTKNKRNLSNRGILNTLGFYLMRLLTGYESKEIVRNHNRSAIIHAAEHLKKGHAVIIFPDGGSNNHQFWYSGIGEIIKELSTEDFKLQLFATQISGISTFSLLRHFLFDLKIHLHKNPVNVVISSPFSTILADINIKHNTTEITEKLRQAYNGRTIWYNNKCFNQNLSL